MTTTPRGQVAHVRIYPEPGVSRLFFHVRIFTSLPDMRRYLRRRRHGRAVVGRRCHGICTNWNRSVLDRGRWRMQPDLGEIVYASRFLGSRILSHECTHAMFAWARRRKLDVTDCGRGRFIGGGEERACGVLGDLMRQVAIYLWDHGLAK